MPCCLITLNNELVFHQMMRLQGGVFGEGAYCRLQRWLLRHANWLANLRYRNYLESVYSRCAGIVALTQGDLPSTLSRNVVTAVIPPVLKQSDVQWSYRASRCVLFVGNIHVLKFVHFGNRLAIEWICCELAPQLLRADDRITINIIGATQDQVPTSWQCANVNLMGRADKEEVDRQMTTADLFIAPISNNFGAKLKLSECVSRGTPFLATEAAMSGLPVWTSIPRIHLEKPRAAADLIVDHMNRPEKLRTLSESISALLPRARMEQDMAWSTFVRRCMGNVRMA